MRGAPLDANAVPWPVLKCPKVDLRIASTQHKWRPPFSRRFDDTKPGRQRQPRPANGISLAEISQCGHHDCFNVEWQVLNAYCAKFHRFDSDWNGHPAAIQNPWNADFHLSEGGDYLEPGHVWKPKIQQREVYRSYSSGNNCRSTGVRWHDGEPNISKTPARRQACAFVVVDD